MSYDNEDDYQRLPQRDPKTKHDVEMHAKKRAEQRYGVELNHEDRLNVVKLIQSGEADFVAKQSNTRSLFKVDYEGSSLNVVYDKVRHALRTVLPQNAWEFQRQAEVTCSTTPTTTGSTQTGSGCIECPDNPCSCPGNWTDDKSGWGS